jgi:hypothetical protein
MTLWRMVVIVVIPVHALKAYGGVEVELHSFLSSVLDEDGWAA